MSEDDQRGVDAHYERRSVEPRVKGQLSEPGRLNGCGRCIWEMSRRGLRLHGVTLSLVCEACLLGVEFLAWSAEGTW